MTQTLQHITSMLMIKFVTAYFARAHKSGPIRVQRRADGSLYLSDGMLAVNVPYTTPVIPYTQFDLSWQRATFPEKVMIAREDGPDIQAFFTSWGNTEVNHILTLTPFLLEVPGATNKPGTLSRKLEADGFSVYIEKHMMDMLSPDLDALTGFLFETSGHERPVRVSAVNGIVAYLMPKCNIERYLKVQ